MAHSPSVQRRWHDHPDPGESRKEFVQAKADLARTIEKRICEGGCW